MWSFGFLRALTLSLPNPLYSVIAQNENPSEALFLVSKRCLLFKEEGFARGTP